MGAEVIKVEQPVKGDDTRHWGPPFIKGDSTYYMSLNRGKKSLTVNLKAPEGKKIIRDLIKKSDIVIQNFPPKTI
jgi:crotonobetainyl-CoA:carnitine CoA-transferase CaiB-like acyl-CoA transferase